ncbi:hypothetical protein P152DRAFT_461628 [Eremomyces bilateralis CBS 781.70]|uniref:Uncharacterized protein n=1 Tax=Eremomyces bilateralis CBS 781.70 TaxID=1392243 RepID=A0A6G1FU46_9PEZI|nr:uncharacterized protein P152DRAFT_461628 [Eremomyces bilateralis CBS 781.70]KAF1809212.1 hypothetical protein P152DRAFT_461628 [Eremomyces bilateralis CBS 781.70]
MAAAAAITAFGAIIGYMGAEVAEDAMFERVLWPQRFHNYLDISSFAKLSLLSSMSGPLHRAALETLDSFRDHGLYKGFLRGDILGTPFFAENSGIEYFYRTALSQKRRETPSSVRNGLWLEVLRQVECRRITSNQKITGSDDHEAAVVSSRAMKPIFRLSLEILPRDGLRKTPGVDVSESHVTVWTFLGILASELPTLFIAIATGLWYRFGNSTSELPDVWLAPFLCIPLFLKIVAALFTVRREDIVGPATMVNMATAEDNRVMSEKAPPLDAPRNPDHRGNPLKPISNPPSGHQQREEKSGATALSVQEPSGTPGRQEIIEVMCPSLGYVLICTNSKPPNSSGLFQFFRHYGHPIRSAYMDRVRETVNIIIVYMFVLYFPAGLFALSWMNGPAQFIWLGQQLYCVAAMHIVRLAGWQGCSRTEERVAKLLLQNKIVYLVGKGGSVQVSLNIEDVPSVREGKARVQAILQQNDEAE